MGVRVWGEIGDRLLEVIAEPGPAGSGLGIEGLPPGRGRTTADRVRASLINAGVLEDVPPVRVRLEPELGGEPTGDLDLAVALGALLGAGIGAQGLRWVVAWGRLTPDGRVAGPEGPVELRDVVAGLCQTPLVGSEHMFERRGP